jgi:hypothetical protein
MNINYKAMTKIFFGPILFLALLSAVPEPVFGHNTGSPVKKICCSGKGDYSKMVYMNFNCNAILL